MATIVRSQPTALDLARDAERFSRDAREAALRMATACGEDPRTTVERAKAYLAFLAPQN